MSQLQNGSTFSSLPPEVRLQQMINRQFQLRQQGYTESSSQELNQLSAFIQLAMKQQHSAMAAAHSVNASARPAPMTNGAVPHPQPAAPTSLPAQPSAAPPLPISVTQMTTLRAQVQALQYIVRNQVVPAHIQQVVYGPDSIDPKEDVPGAIANAQVAEVLASSDAKASAPETSADSSAEPTLVFPEGKILEQDTTSAIYPYNAISTPQQALAQGIKDGKSHKLVFPALIPKGLDPYQVLAERQRFIDARIENRIEELSKLSSTIGDSSVDPVISSEDSSLSLPPSAKIRALIELKSLKLRDKQRALRSSMINRLQESASLSLDRKVFRRVRKPTLKDARHIESLERRQREEREKRAKQKHLDYLQGICLHGEEVLKTGAANRSKAHRLGRAVLKFHVDTEREEQKRIERISRERLKALKADDEEAYLKLIDTAKDTRITHLLRQTDTFLDGLATKVQQQQNVSGNRNLGPLPMGNTDESMFGAAPVMKDDDEETGDAKKKVDYYGVAHRIQEKVTAQPTLLVGGKLKDYQIKGLQWMVSLYNNHLNGILADEMGLGKTIQTISLVCFLIEVKRELGPFLIIVPLSTLTNWTHEFRKWAPGVHTLVYNGSPQFRKDLQPQIRQGGFQVLITTYEYIIREKAVLTKIKWAHMIIDEGHRMKNTNSKLSQTLTQHYATKYRLILTGTPLQNNLPELWSILNFVLPKVFNSVKSFEEWFNTPFANTGTQDKLELNEEETLLVIKRLHKVLRPFLLRRLKKDVESELPDKVEKVVKCKMSALQHQLYQQMKKHGMLFDEEVKGKQVGIKGLNNTIMQFRKICQHPFVFDKIEDRINPSGKLNDSIIRSAGKVALLDQLLPKLFATGHRVLIFFQMTNIMDILGDYFQYRGYNYYRLDGSTKPEDRSTLLTKFNDPNTDTHLFMLSTRAGGLGLNLQTADTVIIYDSDWNPHADLQAQDRAHRIGQKNDVRILRFVTERSIEEVMLARAKSKLDMDGKVIQAGRFDNKSTAEEQEEYLRSLLEGDQEDDIEESASMNDDEINAIVSRNERETEIFRRMDDERAFREEREWREAGNLGPVPPRLMTLEELPPVYQRDEPIKVDETEEILNTRRARAVVRYTDGLTDDQWVEAVESGSVDDLIENRARKARPPPTRIESSPEADDTAGNDDDEWGGGSSAKKPTASKRGRGRPRASSPAGLKRKRPAPPVKQPSISPSIDEEEDIPESKRRKTAKNGEPVPAAMRERMKKVFNECYRAVQNCTAEDGRFRCDLFKELPSKKEYPDYYIQIQQPIAMSHIRKRSSATYYKTMQQYADDWRLMFNNARQYNQEGSWVVNDANELQNVFEAVFDRETSGTDLPGMGGASAVGSSHATPAPTRKAKKKIDSDDEYVSD